MNDVSNAPPIEVRGLVARYGDLVAVDGIDLIVPKGTCVGLLGPNGAGKTTTIEILEGLRPAFEGSVLVFGSEWSGASVEIRERIGVHLQETEFQDRLTAFEVLRLFRSFYRQGQSPDEILNTVELSEKRDARVGTLSGGQKQRLALGCALVNRPEILFLDEPTAGLDPRARRRVWQIIEEFKQNGGTVLLTTHFMDEAERLADNLSIMDQGKIIGEGSPDKIIRSLEAESIVEFTLEPDARGEYPTIDPRALRALDAVKDGNVVGGVWALSVTDTRVALTSLLEWLEDSQIRTQDIRTHRPTLEDVFVSMTGKHLRDD